MKKPRYTKRRARLLAHFTALLEKRFGRKWRAQPLEFVLGSGWRAQKSMGPLMRWANVITLPEDEVAAGEKRPLRVQWRAGTVLPFLSEGILRAMLRRLGKRLPKRHTARAAHARNRVIRWRRKNPESAKTRDAILCGAFGLMAGGYLAWAMQKRVA